MVEHKRGRTVRLPAPSIPSARWESKPPPTTVDPVTRDPEVTSVDEFPPELAAALKEPPPVRSLPAPGGIEIQVIREDQAVVRVRKPWRAAEVWTKNRVYGLDSTMTCFEILDRATGKSDGNHSMLGSRLGGGRTRDAGGVRFSYPFPLPGMEAMFTEGKKCGYTSPVERFLLRIRVLYTRSDDLVPTWEDVASRWVAPPKAKK